uniref:U-box domain-containing protein n=1 Tax=Populus alba TaxID=43335 RepID=A0A4U5Q2J0_POPAL|nr:hypothetical protein D5086_0000159760 [Populus alba]
MEGFLRWFSSLSYQDPNIQEHTHGTNEARENSAAALFSLSMLDENKVLIGASNGIRPLVHLLQNGTIRGKKDAATALFNLSLNQTNKSRAIKAGIIPALLHLLEEKNLGMIDEALSIFLLLASHPEGRNEIGKLSFIKTLIDIHKKRDSQEQGMRPIGPSPAGVAQFIHHPSSTSVWCV